MIWREIISIHSVAAFLKVFEKIVIIGGVRDKKKRKRKEDNKTDGKWLVASRISHIHWNIVRI